MFVLFCGLSMLHRMIPGLLILVVLYRSGQNDTDEGQKEDGQEI
jgi:hypothetical protein